MKPLFNPALHRRSLFTCVGLAGRHFHDAHVCPNGGALSEDRQGSEREQRADEVADEGAEQAVDESALHGAGDFGDDDEGILQPNYGGFR